MNAILTEHDEALCRRTAELVIEAMKATPLPTAPMANKDVLTRAEAMAYVKKNSTTAFCVWCRKWGVRPGVRGRYSRQRLDVVLDREARKSA